MILLTWLDRADRNVQIVHPRGDLSRQRDAYVVEERKKQKAPADGFDEQVLRQLRAQARRIGVQY